MGEAGQGHQSPWVLSAAPVSPRAAQRPSVHQAGEFGVPGPDCPSLNLEGVCCACKTLECHIFAVKKQHSFTFHVLSVLHTTGVLCHPSLCTPCHQQWQLPLEPRGTGIAGLLQVTAPCESSHTTCFSPDPSKIMILEEHTGSGLAPWAHQLCPSQWQHRALLPLPVTPPQVGF